MESRPVYIVTLRPLPNVDGIRALRRGLNLRPALHFDFNKKEVTIGKCIAAIRFRRIDSPEGFHLGPSAAIWGSPSQRLRSNAFGSRRSRANMPV
jgi:hypothetical protein